MLHLKTILLGGSAKHFLPSTSQRAFSRVIASGLVLHTHWLGKNLMTTSSRISIFQCREYHFTMLVAAKAKGGKKGKGGQDADDDSATAAAAVELPKIKSMEPQIEKIFRRLDEEFAKHRVGKVSGDVFNELPVGNSGLIRDVGQVTVKSPTKVSVSVYDATVTGLVVDAIKGCGMGLNPTVEGSTIIINIPKPSKEARDAMVKMIGKVAEKVRKLFPQHCIHQLHNDHEFFINYIAIVLFVVIVVIIITSSPSPSSTS